jgi:hypothetical protein
MGPGIYLCWDVGFQEPWQLLQAWENQAFRQQAFWGLLSRCELQEGSAVALQACGNQDFVSTCWHRLPGAMVADAGLREPSLLATRVLGPDFQPGLQEAQISGAAAGSGEPSLLACGFCYQWSCGSHASCLHRDTGLPGVSW